MATATIYTPDEVAVALFGQPDASCLEIKEATMVEAAIEASTSLICAFLRKSLEFEERDALLTAGDAYTQNPILPAKQMAEGLTAIRLKDVPVQLVGLSVWLNENEQEFEDEHLLVEGVDYSLEDVVDGLSFTGVLRRRVGNWPEAPGGVRVTYTGGLGPVESPEDWNLIRRAALVTIRQEFSKLQILDRFRSSDEAGVLQSEDIGEWKTTYDTKGAEATLFGGGSEGLPPEAVWILEPLVSYGEWI